MKQNKRNRWKRVAKRVHRPVKIQHLGMLVSGAACAANPERFTVAMRLRRAFAEIACDLNSNGDWILAT